MELKKKKNICLCYFSIFVQYHRVLRQDSNYFSVQLNVKELCGRWRWSLEAPWLAVLQLGSCERAYKGIRPSQGLMGGWWACRMVFFCFFFPLPPFLFFFLPLRAGWFSGFRSDLAWYLCLYPDCSIPLRTCFLADLYSYLQESFPQRDSGVIFLAGCCYCSSKGLWVLTKKCQPFAVRQCVCICSTSDVCYHDLVKRLWQVTALQRVS